MKTAWKIIRPLLLFMAVYTMLILPQTGVNRMYASYLCRLGNILYEDFSRGGFVRLTPQTDNGKNDISLFLSRSDWKQQGRLTGVTTNKASDLIGFLATAFFVALTLATPINWQRKALALPAGLIMMTAYVLWKLRFIILHAYTQVPWFGLFQEENTISAINWWYIHFGANASQGFVVAFVVWLILVTGQKEWEKIQSLKKTIPLSGKNITFKA